MENNYQTQEKLYIPKSFREMVEELNTKALLNGIETVENELHRFQHIEQELYGFTDQLSSAIEAISDILCRPLISKDELTIDDEIPF